MIHNCRGSRQRTSFVFMLKFITCFTQRRAWIVAETHDPRLPVAQTLLRTWLYDSIILPLRYIFLCRSPFSCLLCRLLVSSFCDMSPLSSIFYSNFYQNCIFKIFFSSSNKRTIQCFDQQLQNGLETCPIIPYPKWQVLFFLYIFQNALIQEGFADEFYCIIVVFGRLPILCNE